MTTAGMASGAYRYRLNGEPAAVEETWRREPIGQGCWRVTSRRRAADVAIDVEAQEAHGVVTAFTAEWRHEDGGSLAVDYQLQGSVLSVVRRESARAPLHTEMTPGAAPLLLFPLMRIFVGPVIDGLLRAGGTGIVILPEIAVPPDSAKFFEPRCSDRRAAVVAEEFLEDEAGAARLCRRCRYLGDQYDEAASFWLGADGLLERYQWRQQGQGAWQVDLIRDG